MIGLKEEEGQGLEVSPAIRDYDGVMMPPWATVNNILHEALQKLQLRRPDIVPAEMGVFNRTSIHRGNRRGAHTRAKEVGVPETYILMHNRRRGVHQRRGSLPNMPISKLYMEITQSLKLKLTFPLGL